MWSRFIGVGIRVGMRAMRGKPLHMVPLESNLMNRDTRCKVDSVAGVDELVWLEDGESIWQEDSGIAFEL